MRKRFRSAFHKFTLRFGWSFRRVGAFHRAIETTYFEKGSFSFAQIGAFDGVSHDSLYWLVSQYHGHGIVVEPLPDVFSRLKKNYEWLPAVTPLCCAVHPSKLSIELYRVSEDNNEVPVWAKGSSSLDARWLTEQGIPASALIKEQVKAVPLMDLLIGSDIQSLDVLQIDAEGFDHEIIRMIDFDLIRPRVIKYEYTKKETTEGARLEREMADYLVTKKYRVLQEFGDVVAISN